METPKQWKSLRRHPISADYDDCTEEEIRQTADDLLKHGNLDGRKIVIYEGMVLDGWQFLRAHVLADIVPEVTLFRPEGDFTAKEYARIKNENRRHEDWERRRVRIEKRRQKVKDLFSQNPDVTADEVKAETGTSTRTAYRDIESAKVASHKPVPHGTKKNDAPSLNKDAKPAVVETKAPPKEYAQTFKLDDFNTHFDGLVKQTHALAEFYGKGDTQQGEDLRADLAEWKAKWKEVTRFYRGEKAEQGNADIPVRLRPVFAAVTLFKRTQRAARYLAGLLFDLERSDAYRAAAGDAKKVVYSSYVRGAEAMATSMMPDKVCPDCNGVEGSPDADPCKCGGKGFLTHGEQS